ncbi:curli-like amyloid fiber formation chaperone CsgH [Erythrobacteraceae bacterium WH01K]|nr:curli-like amyloid fiber formation chaperone CsgH [Erythrobacteraceae bacterium WH01K]
MNTTKALSMEVSDSGNEAEIEIIANSGIAQSVEYEIEITGQSRAVHKGRTDLAAGSTHTLSRFRVSYADEWCARLSVKEQAGSEYVLFAGTCEQTDPVSN